MDYKDMETELLSLSLWELAKFLGAVNWFKADILESFYEEHEEENFDSVFAFLLGMVRTLSEELNSRINASKDDCELKEDE